MSVTDAEKTSRSPKEEGIGTRSYLPPKPPSVLPAVPAPEINPAVNESLPKKYDIETALEKRTARDLPTEWRPRKFTPTVKKKIIQAFQLGAHEELAANYGGVSHSTLQKWFRRGSLAGPNAEGIEKELYEFQEECRQLAAGGNVSLLGIIWQHAQDDGNVAIKLLEKLYPTFYGARMKHDHSHDHSGTVEHVHSVDYSKFSDEELEEVERLALKAQEEDVIDAELVE